MEAFFTWLGDTIEFLDVYAKEIGHGIGLSDGAIMLVLVATALAVGAFDFWMLKRAIRSLRSDLD